VSSCSSVCSLVWEAMLVAGLDAGDNFPLWLKFSCFDGLENRRNGASDPRSALGSISDRTIPLCSVRLNS